VCVNGSTRDQKGAPVLKQHLDAHLLLLQEKNVRRTGAREPLLYMCEKLLCCCSAQRSATLLCVLCMLMCVCMMYVLLYLLDIVSTVSEFKSSTTANTCVRLANTCVREITLLLLLLYDTSSSLL
jgi:hypothetical protein